MSFEQKQYMGPVGFKLIIRQSNDDFRKIVNAQLPIFVNRSNLTKIQAYNFALASI